MRAELASSACVAAEAVLARVGVEKALDPLDPEDFLIIVARLASALRRATASEEAAALKAALRALDVDWRGLTPAARDQVFEAARRSLGAVPAAVLPQVREEFEAAGTRVYRGARQSASRRFRLRIQPSLSLRDRQAERFVRTLSSNFVRDEYGRRRDELSEVAREVVARGLERGLGSADIASDIAGALGDKVVRSDSYWTVVAMAHANTARTLSQLYAYEEAGVQRYVFEAVLDEVTTDQCRFYHGRTFTTSSGVAKAGELLAGEPEDVKSTVPWIRVGREGEERVLYVDRGQGREVLAQVDRSGMGRKDDVGEYSKAKSTEELAGIIPWPPLHGRCRSTILADV